MAKIIAGLGNVGAEYAATRHNIGFWVIDALAEKWELTFSQGEGAFLVASRKYKSEDLYLIKPTNYMNNSGRSLKKACAKLNVEPENMMVVYDDIHIDTGVLRIRSKGSHGGHNGIKDIIEQFATQQFPRLRIGVGNDFRPGRQADYVLSAFPENEMDIVKEACENAQKALITWLKAGINHAMSQHNG